MSSRLKNASDLQPGAESKRAAFDNLMVANNDDNGSLINQSLEHQVLQSLNPNYHAAQLGQNLQQMNGAKYDHQDDYNSMVEQIALSQSH